MNFVLHPVHSYPDPLCPLFPESNVERNLDNMFNIESLGIPNSEENISDYDSQQIAKFQNSIKFINGHYEVKLPWHEDKLKDVPSNYNVSLAVLDRVYKKLEKQNLVQDYVDTFLQQEKDEIIERIVVKPEDYTKYTFIPHRPIIKQGTQVTTKIRPVFNCSLKTNQAPSLNEAAYAGINLMNDMTQLLLYFRSNKITMMSDIKKAFLMIRLSEEHDKNRFCFFLKIGNELLCFRYKTIIFGFNASPFILNFVIKHHAKSFPSDSCSDILLNNFFVDNLLCTSNSKNELSLYYHELYDRMKQGGFTLRSWTSSDPDLRQEMINNNHYVEHDSPVEKVLGYNYSTQDDFLQLSQLNIKSECCSKRTILSESSKIFDPLGLVLPVTVQSKLLMREIWLKKFTWDENLDSDILHCWKSLAHDLTGLHELQFPRQAIDDDITADLVLFCDASKRAYSFAAYSIQSNRPSANLLFSKSKVAPIKEKSLPTLELLSVYLAIKCLPFILDSYPKAVFRDIIVAVDAQVVLSWLLTGEIQSQNQFAKNRLADIFLMIAKLKEEFKINLSFKFVPTSDNPADLATRGLSLKKFKDMFDFWINGPKWLVNAHSAWPKRELKCLSDTSKALIQTNVAFQVKPYSQESSKHLVKIENYSDYNKLLHVTNIIFKFIALKCDKFMKQRNSAGLDTTRSATIYLFKTMQSDCFESEIAFLKNPANKKIPNLVDQLNLFLDEDGLLRSAGRIGKQTDYSWEVHNPILLGKHHHLSKLIINHYHLQVKHLGVPTTLNNIRMAGLWVPKARQVVKNVLSQCVTCQKFNGLPFKYPKNTNLPKHRVNLITPFLYIGIDFTGHILLADGAETKKYYILIFTCLCTRAVHLELVPDMSTHSFVSAMLRFSNLYGVPSHIYSDNCRSFLRGCDIFSQVFTSKEYSNHFQMFQIKHIKIPVYSPWVGSVYERLIGVLKSCIRKTVGRAKINYFDMLTLLSDVQNAVNSRPLTYRSADPNIEIITPNHFIHPNTSTNLFLKAERNVQDPIGPPSQADLLESLTKRDLMLQNFRKIWNEAYLLSLREKSANAYKPPFVSKIKIGDIVLLRSPQKSRAFWPLGKVIDTILGDDGLVRSARVKRADGSIQLYSTCHLYPLELSQAHSQYLSTAKNISFPDDPDTSLSVTEVNDQTDPPTTASSGNRRSQRLAHKNRAKLNRDSAYVYY